MPHTHAEIDTKSHSDSIMFMSKARSIVYLSRRRNKRQIYYPINSQFPSLDAGKSRR